MLLYCPTVDKLSTQTYAIKVFTVPAMSTVWTKHLLCLLVRSLPLIYFLFVLRYKNLWFCSLIRIFCFVFGIKKIGVAFVCLFVSLYLTFFLSVCLSCSNKFYCRHHFTTHKQCGFLSCENCSGATQRDSNHCCYCCYITSNSERFLNAPQTPISPRNGLKIYDINHPHTHTPI